MHGADLSMFAMHAARVFEPSPDMFLSYAKVEHATFNFSGAQASGSLSKRDAHCWPMLLVHRAHSEHAR